MPSEKIGLIHKFQEIGVFGYAWILLISIWAGTARYLSALNGKAPTFIGWMTETVISGFVGMIVAVTCRYYQVDFLLTSAITGIAAHNGTRTLYLISEAIRRSSPGMPNFYYEKLQKKPDEKAK